MKKKIVGITITTLVGILAFAVPVFATDDEINCTKGHMKFFTSDCQCIQTSKDDHFDPGHSEVQTFEPSDIVDMNAIAIEPVEDITQTPPCIAHHKDGEHDNELCPNSGTPTKANHIQHRNGQHRNQN